MSSYLLSVEIAGAYGRPPAAGAPRIAAGSAGALRVLRSHERELRATGVTGLAIFGSLARGDAGESSDVDLVLDLGEDATLGLFDLVDLRETLAAELGRSVDLAFRSRLRPWFAARIAPDLVRVF